MNASLINCPLYLKKTKYFNYNVGVWENNLRYGYFNMVIKLYRWLFISFFIF